MRTTAQSRAKKPTTPIPAATMIAKAPSRIPRAASKSSERRLAAAGEMLRGSLTRVALP